MSLADTPSYAPGRTGMLSCSMMLRSTRAALSGTGAPLGGGLGRQRPDHVIRRHDQGEVVVEPPHGVAVQLLLAVCAGVLDEHDTVVQVGCVANRALDATARHDAADQQPFH